ncbi:MAG TPA: ABC transporter permease [Pseudonocardiaceae bacterium]|jgi:ABC-2 type transport system permease protein|nr:ABC transporter permease [Pseudonocardiaceae bacterium]
MTTASRFAPGTFTPAPGVGRRGTMLFTQARTEALLAFRNGEQVLLTVLIPLALLVGLTLVTIIPMPAPRVDAVTPRVFALAIMSSAFTGQAIALGFDRRYGVLKRLAATAIPRWLLVGGRLLAAVVIVVVQLVVLGVVAAIMGWSPRLAGVAPAVLLVVLGTLAFGALGVLLGGSLRAEIVLALANIIWFVLLLAGGAGIASNLPQSATDILVLLPSGALAEGLYGALGHGGTPLWECLLVLLVWFGLAGGLATRTTKLT